MQRGLHNWGNHILNNGCAVHLGNALMGDSGGHTLDHSANLGQGGLLDVSCGCTVHEWCSCQMTWTSGSNSNEGGENELLI